MQHLLLKQYWSICWKGLLIIASATTGIYGFSYIKNTDEAAKVNVLNYRKTSILSEDFFSQPTSIKNTLNDLIEPISNNDDERLFPLENDLKNNQFHNSVSSTKHKDRAFLYVYSSKHQPSLQRLELNQWIKNNHSYICQYLQKTDSTCLAKKAVWPMEQTDSSKFFIDIQKEDLLNKHLDNPEYLEQATFDIFRIEVSKWLFKFVDWATLSSDNNAFHILSENNKKLLKLNIAFGLQDNIFYGKTNKFIGTLTAGHEEEANQTIGDKDQTYCNLRNDPAKEEVCSINKLDLSGKKNSRLNEALYGHSDLKSLNNDERITIQFNEDIDISSIQRNGYIKIVDGKNKHKIKQFKLTKINPLYFEKVKNTDFYIYWPLFEQAVSGG